MHTAYKMSSHRHESPLPLIGNPHTCNTLASAETICRQPDYNLERGCVIAPSPTSIAHPLMPEPHAIDTYNIFKFGGLLRQMPSSFYYCCQCDDGPKLFENQPMCVNCNHTVCGNCRPA
jgi:hypothetical protein